MKKLLLIACLLVGTVSFAQQVETNSTFRSSDTPPPTLSEISAYPNPFTVNTRINFKSTKSQIMEFTVKNLLGKTVYLEQVNAKPGLNSILFTRNNITKGMYIYSLKTETEVVSKRLVIR
jgi:hypothetical protein